MPTKHQDYAHQSEDEGDKQMLSYAEMAKTPPRRRKGKQDEYEFGSSYLRGTGTQKKSNIRSDKDPFHQMDALVLHNTQQNKDISAKGLRGDDES